MEFSSHLKPGSFTEGKETSRLEERNVITPENIILEPGNECFDLINLIISPQGLRSFLRTDAMMYRELSEYGHLQKRRFFITSKFKISRLFLVMIVLEVNVITNTNNSIDCFGLGFFLDIFVMIKF